MKNLGIHLNETRPLIVVYFNLVRYFIAHNFSIKKKNKDTMENTHITQIFFPWKPKLGKPTYSIFIHSDTFFTIQYTYRRQKHPKP
jgi:hypothetical protein